MGDDQNAVLPRVEIGVEHAIIVAELELEAGPFLDLERGASKVSREVPRRHSVETGHLAVDGNDGRRLCRRGLRRRLGGAGGEQKG